MAEYSRLAKGHVSSLGGLTPVYLPFVPDYVELINYTAAGTSPLTDNLVPEVKWDVMMGQGAAVYWTYASTGTSPATDYLRTATITSGGISTFSAGLPQLGAALPIASISKAAAAVVTTVSAHGLASGNVVILSGLYQSASTGMIQLSNIPFVVTVTGSTTFTINANTNQSNFTALSGSPAGAAVRQVLYPYLYFPGINYVMAISTGSTTIVNTAANHNLVVGQEVAFRIPSAFGTTQLNSPDIYQRAQYGFVTAVNSALQVVVNINSSSYTAFNSNPTFAAALAGGFNWAQMVAVGDNNLGIVTNQWVPNYSSTLPYNSVWAPAIGGAFQNNTSQGFTIGSSVAGNANDVIYWRAFLHDYST